MPKPPTAPRSTAASRANAAYAETAANPPHPEALASASAAGLRYVNEGALPGWRRRRAGKGFTYQDEHGQTLRDPQPLQRIRHLAIPPAWTSVWICPWEDGHIQAIGRDAKNRKQYRYHERWRQVRDQTKFQRMAAFGAALPTIREAVDRDLRLSGLPRRKVLATVVRLLEVTRIRIGNREYADKNDSYGLTTLHDDHLDVQGARMRFHFRGKSGKEHEVTVRDRRLATVLRQCQELPGQELFQYVDEAGQRQKVGSADVNEYLREISGADFTAKDYRTWAGTVLAAERLRPVEWPETGKLLKRVVKDAIEAVAAALGNTPAVCRKCYVHPLVLQAFESGQLRHLDEHSDAEALVLALLALPIPKEPTLAQALRRSLRRA
jgi:DNA topoisomerase-1